MTKGLIFFCCACTILLFTIINISIGPIINGKVGAYDPINLIPDWGTSNCRQLQDNYDKAKKLQEVKNEIPLITCIYEIKDNNYTQIINNKSRLYANEEIEKKIKILNGDKKEKLVFQKNLVISE